MRGREKIVVARGGISCIAYVRGLLKDGEGREGKGREECVMGTEY